MSTDRLNLHFPGQQGFKQTKVQQQVFLASRTLHHDGEKEPNPRPTKRLGRGIEKVFSHCKKMKRSLSLARRWLSGPGRRRILIDSSLSRKGRHGAQIGRGRVSSKDGWKRKPSFWSEKGRALNHKGKEIFQRMAESGSRAKVKVGIHPHRGGKKK